MIPKAVPSPARDRGDAGDAGASLVRGAAADRSTGLGVDVGASLVKFAIPTPDGNLEFQLAHRRSAGELVAAIRSFQRRRVGLSGCGAASLAEMLGDGATAIGEFEAWAAGAQTLYERAGLSAPERFLAVSIGTGTSAILVEPGSVTRVGGCALGGGTVAGLGAALLGSSDFDTVVAQAEQGDRWAVDLPVSEIYPDGAKGLIAVNASSFAKLALDPGARAPADLASAVLSLVGENIGFICAGLARAVDVEEIAYGGTTLHVDSAIRPLLAGTAAIHGRRAVFLGDGAFTGAVGALVLSEA